MFQRGVALLMKNIWRSISLMKSDVSEMIYIEIVGGNMPCYHTDEFLCKQLGLNE